MVSQEARTSKLPDWVYFSLAILPWASCFTSVLSPYSRANFGSWNSWAGEGGGMKSVPQWSSDLVSATHPV